MSVRRWILVLCVAVLGGATLLPAGPVYAAGKLRSAGIAPTALYERLGRADPPLLIDVRSPSAYSAGHLPGAVNLPAPTVTRHLDRIRQAPSVVLYCNDRRFTAVAEQLLYKARVKGFSHLEGGMTAWLEEGLPVENSLPE